MTSIRIDQNLTSELLAKAKRKGATAADAVAVEGDAASVQVRLSVVDKLSKAQEKRLGLRVYLGQRSAGASTSDLSPASLDELVETRRSWKTPLQVCPTRLPWRRSGRTSISMTARRCRWTG